jgi:hypothetical protein
MNFRQIPATNVPGATTCTEPAVAITQLVGEVYEAAPPVERSRLIEQLLRPLGVLSMVAIANGIFAKIAFRGGWQNLHVRPEDIQNVRVSDVIALVDYAQQACIDAVDGLALTLASSPVLAGSAAAALLIALLIQRSRSRRAIPSDEDDINEHYAG